jgi:hypothetical protein
MRACDRCDMSLKVLDDPTPITTMPRILLLFLALAARGDASEVAAAVEPAAGACHWPNGIGLDFANPAAGFEWTDAAGELGHLPLMLPSVAYLTKSLARIAGQRHVGSWDSSGSVKAIPFGTTDATGGALPGGSVRWTNAGALADGRAIDLVVSIPDTPLDYTDASTGQTLSINYVSPISAFVSQAVSTSVGYACLGLGIEQATCASGVQLDRATATCESGVTTISGADFEFKLMLAGTDTVVPELETFFLTFFDVDGDVQGEDAVFEFTAVTDAQGHFIHHETLDTIDVFGSLEANRWRTCHAFGGRLGSCHGV